MKSRGDSREGTRVLKYSRSHKYSYTELYNGDRETDKYLSADNKVGGSSGIRMGRRMHTGGARAEGHGRMIRRCLRR